MACPTRVADRRKSGPAHLSHFHSFPPLRQISPASGFLLKDLILLGSAIWTAGEALSADIAARANTDPR